MGGSNNNLQPAPKYCTYGITIREVACGEEHTAFITNDNHLYTIGSNKYGQLGIADSQTRLKNSPVLVEHFVNTSEYLGVNSVACGHNHTVVSTMSGHLFTWGSNQDGSLGISSTNNQYSPQKVQVGNIENPNIV